MTTEHAARAGVGHETGRTGSVTYASYVDGELRLPGGLAAPANAQRVHDALRALVLDAEYPCVGSRSALNQGSYRFALYEEMASPETTPALARDLSTFVQEQDSINGEFTTFIAAFESPKVKDPIEFEGLLWQQLRMLHALDKEGWDASVSRDPDDPRFAFSFGGRAFFVVGLSPSGERWARTFPWPLLAFNAHQQFRELRRTGKFERMQEIVRERDEALEGEVNPNLSDWGSHTEARQYSGREVDDGWRCPVRFEED
jgi:FPC/CPF motif-containing protein YcgG